MNKSSLHGNVFSGWNGARRIAWVLFSLAVCGAISIYFVLHSAQKIEGTAAAECLVTVTHNILSGLPRPEWGIRDPSVAAQIRERLEGLPTVERFPEPQFGSYVLKTEGAACRLPRGILAFAGKLKLWDQEGNETFLEDKRGLGEFVRATAPMAAYAAIGADLRIRQADLMQALHEANKEALLGECLGSPQLGIAAFGDLDGDGVEEAAATGYSCLSGTGGADLFGVFRLTASGQLESVKVAKLPERFKEIELRTGLMEHMSIAIQKARLVQSLPVYRPNDANCCPSGGRRTFFFRWENGGLVLDDVIEARATTSTALNYPAGLAEAVQRCCPGFRLPQDNDVRAAWVDSDGEGSVPFFVKGDFNGDGSADAAVILLAMTGAKAQLAVFEAAPQGYRRAHAKPLEHVRALRIDTPQEIVLRLVPKGEGWAPEGGDVPATYEHPFDAVAFETRKADVGKNMITYAHLVFWNGKLYAEY